jgi:hypothetical protein
VGRLQPRRDLARSLCHGQRPGAGGRSTVPCGSREVAALEALRANAKAVELLTARRWYVIRSAREAGATWAQIGEALGITKQAVHDFYRRKIEEQEKYLPDLHDVASARAVLEEVKED